MPWEIQYVPAKETVVVTPTGPLSEAEAKHLTRQAIALLKETQATRVLGDCRGIESGLSFGAVYWLVNDCAGCGVPRQTRIALVHSHARRAVELAQFCETVCFNQHYEARTFHTRSDAEAWLHSGATA
jgi:hypothetical protein